MADKTFEDLYDFVLPFLPGAEPGIVDLHMRRALREFLTRTTVWRETFEFDTVAGVSAYQLTPTKGVVASVLGVEIDGRPADVLPEHQRQSTSPVGAARRWYGLLPEVINFYPTPEGVQAMRVEVAVTMPIDGSLREFPEAVYNAYAEPIAAGVIASMMQMPGKPWTQRDASKEYARVFGAAIRDTPGKLRDGGQPNQSTFTGRRFGV